jgi:hypothetical protein
VSISLSWANVEKRFGADVMVEFDRLASDGRMPTKVRLVERTWTNVDGLWADDADCPGHNNPKYRGRYDVCRCHYWDGVTWLHWSRRDMVRRPLVPRMHGKNRLRELRQEQDAEIEMRTKEWSRLFLGQWNDVD